MAAYITENKLLLNLIDKVPKSFWSNHSAVYKIYKKFVLKPEGSMEQIGFLLGSLQGQRPETYGQFREFDDVKKIIPKI